MRPLVLLVAEPERRVELGFPSEPVLLWMPCRPCSLGAAQNQQRCGPGSFSTTPPTADMERSTDSDGADGTRERPLRPSQPYDDDVIRLHTAGGSFCGRSIPICLFSSHLS